MESNSKFRIFICAGDPSGDLHASRLMKQLKEKLPDVEFIGIGGPEMEKQGLDSLVSMKEISVVGFLEVAKRYFFFKKLESQCQKILSEQKIDLFLPVDYPGFNMRLAKFAKSIGIKVCYYIAPQLWAWGNKRAVKLTDTVDKMLVILPFEVDFFSRYAIDVSFVGHPLLDYEEFDKDHKVERQFNKLCLVAGSRQQEVERHLGLFSDIIKKLDRDMYDPVITMSNNVDEEIYKKYIKDDTVKFSKDSRQAFKECYCGIVKTGTSTLEAALLGMPFVMIYKTSTISYLIAKSMVNIEYLSLPNVLMNREIVKEYIQGETDPNEILEQVYRIFASKDYYDILMYEFRRIRKMLDQGNAAKNAANIIIEDFV